MEAKYVPTYSAWAKRDREAGPDGAWLSLLGHSVDVAAVAEALVRLPTWHARLSTLAKRSLNDSDIARLSCFALWHDIGKAQVGFQSRKFPDTEAARIRRVVGLGQYDVGHTRIVASLFAREDLKPALARALPMKSLTRWGDAWWSFLWAAISHHGAPLAWIAGTEIDIGDAANCRTAFKATNALGHEYDPMAEISALGDAARSLFPCAFAEDVDPLPEAPAFVHAFAGLISLADWIASNCDNGFFPYDGAPDGRGGEGPRARYTFASKRAKEVLRAMRIDPQIARNYLRNRQPEFGDVFRDKSGAPYQATGIQAAMSDPTLGQIVVVESETGSGKTEAAFWRFATLFIEGKVDGLAFLMPTRVSATALMGRMESFLNDLFETEEGGKAPLNAVLGVPGYIRADGETALGVLPGFVTLWPEATRDDKDPDSEHRRWAAESAKRYFAAAAMVGTVDQALMAALRVKHAHMRSTALMRSLLIVDEVHASDTYMTYLLEEALTRHTAAGGHALLLSATLAGEIRDKLLSPGRRRDAFSANHLVTPYPAVIDPSGVRYAPESPRSRQIHVHPHDLLNDPSGVATMALDFARAGARVLVIRNTVAGARAVFDALEESASSQDKTERLFRANTVPALHHGRYAAEDRQVLDRAVETFLGKGSDMEGSVVIGTQTLEISLDIDADILITDLCPMDVLLQRLGRLHRHAGRKRPRGFETAQVLLLAPDDGVSSYLSPKPGRSSHGFGTVYSNMPALQAAWHDLPSGTKITIPEDCRRLVESAVGPSRLRERCEAWGGSWPKAWDRARGEALAAAGEAHYARFSFETAWADQQAFARADEERLRTRLGGDDALVELPEVWRSPFGSNLRRFKIPGWMTRQCSEVERNTLAEIIVAIPGERLEFRWCGQRFRYDSMGLDRIEGDPDGEDAE